MYDLDLLGEQETETHRLFGDAVPSGHGDDDDGLLKVDEVEGVLSFISRLTRE